MFWSMYGLAKDGFLGMLSFIGLCVSQQNRERLNKGHEAYSKQMDEPLPVPHTDRHARGRECGDNIHGCSRPFQLW